MGCIAKGREETTRDSPLRRVGAEINMVYNEDVVGVVAVAEAERVLAGNGSPLASQRFLVVEEAEGEAICGHKGAEEQREDARGDLHGGIGRGV